MALLLMLYTGKESIEVFSSTLPYCCGGVGGVGGVGGAAGVDDKDGVTFNRFPSSSYSGMGMSVAFLSFHPYAIFDHRWASTNLVPCHFPQGMRYL